MSPQLFLKIKGLVIMPIGLALAIVPGLVITLFGGEVVPIGNFFAQLFGLILAGIGWGMFKTKQNPGFHDSIGNAICDLIAVALTVMAIQAGTLGLLAYLLAATYLVSALGYIYSCKVACSQG